MSKFHLFALLACAIMAPPLIAETSVLVTLGSIGDRVRSQNPDLDAARLRIAEAIGRMNQSGRLSNPSLETSFDVDTRFREGMLDVGMSQKFPVTDRLRLEKRVSATELKAAKAEVLEVEREIVAQARELLVKVLANRQRRDLLREQLAVSKDFADFLSKVAAKGEGSTLDAGQARLETGSLAMEMRLLDASDAALHGEMKPLLGMHPGESLLVSGRLPDPSIPVVAVNLANRPDFQVATLNAEAAGQDVMLEKALRYEDVEGGFFGSAKRAEDAPEGLEDEVMFGFRFEVALPFWDKKEGAIQEAKARKQRMEKETLALGRGIRLEAEAARAEMAEWKRMIDEIDNTLLPLADEQSQLAEAAYRKGQSEIESVLRSREKRLQLSAAKLDALREFHLARVRHEIALGNH